MGPRILHLETGRHLYGGARQVAYLLSGLAGRHWGEHHLACPPQSEIAGAAADLDCRVHPLPMGGELDIFFFSRWLHLITQVKPDLVHVHSRRGADLWGGLGAYLHKVPAVLTRRVDNPEKGPILRAKCRLYARVVTISRGIEDVLLRQGVPGRKIRCVPSAVDWEAHQVPPDRKWLQTAFGFAPGDLVVGMLAQFIDRKGHDVLLQAMPQILDKCPQTRFLLLGQGPLYAQVAEQVEKMGLGSVVCMPGFRDDVRTILPCLDVVVHPARMEGLGVSLLQAAASGVPIVASRVGGIPEIVRDRENGLLISPGKPDELARACTELLQDPELRQAMGRSGRETAGTHFSIPAMVEGNMHVYQELFA